MIWPLSILQKRYFSRDWVGVWYEILKERGENDLCTVGRARWHDGKLESRQAFEYSHSLMDGSASIPFYLTKLGANYKPLYSNYKKKISCWQHIKLAFAAHDISPASKPLWREDNDRRPSDNNEFHIAVIEKDKTERFNKFLSDNKLSQNLVLLSLLNKYVFELIKDEGQVQNYSWLLPINIRGIVNKKSAYENHTSFVQLRLNAQSQYESIKEVFGQKVKSLNHIGLWWIHHIGVLFGKNYMTKLSKNSASKNFWLGTFSNVGTWNVNDADYDSLGEGEVWFATTPGSRNFPIGMVAMEFNGRLTLTIKVHPSIALDNITAAKTLADKIISEIDSSYS